MKKNNLISVGTIGHIDHSVSGLFENTICQTLEQAREWFLRFRQPFCIIEHKGVQAKVYTYPEAVAFFEQA